VNYEKNKKGSITQQSRQSPYFYYSAAICFIC